MTEQTIEKIDLIEIIKPLDPLSIHNAVDTRNKLNEVIECLGKIAAALNTGYIIAEDAVREVSK